MEAGREDGQEETKDREAEVDHDLGLLDGTDEDVEELPPVLLTPPKPEEFGLMEILLTQRETSQGISIKRLT